MAKDVFDILLGDDEDLLIAPAPIGIGGDFVVGESTAQHQKLLLLTGPGDWKQNPMAGVNAESFTDDEGMQVPIAIGREIAKQFMADGMEVESLTPNPNSMTDNTVKVFEQAYYK